MRDNLLGLRIIPSILLLTGVQFATAIQWIPALPESEPIRLSYCENFGRVETTCHLWKKCVLHDSVWRPHRPCQQPQHLVVGIVFDKRKASPRKNFTLGIEHTQFWVTKNACSCCLLGTLWLWPLPGPYTWEDIAGMDGTGQGEHCAKYFNKKRRVGIQTNDKKLHRDSFLIRYKMFVPREGY